MEAEILRIFQKLGYKKVRILELLQGHSNNNFIIETSEGKFVLRQARKDLPNSSNLLNEKIILEFLETQNIYFIPKSIFYDEKEGIHIITFLEGRLGKIDNLNKNQLEDLSKKVSILNNLSYNDFKIFLKLNNYEMLSLDSPDYIIKKYTLEPFKYIKKYLDDKKLLTYIEKIVSRNLNLFSLNKSLIHFVHGDLIDNFLVDGNSLNFIDWELSRFLNSKGIEIGFILRTSNLSSNENKFILNKYLEYSDLCEEEVIAKSNFDIITCLANDILWAVKMFVEMRERNMVGWKKYEIIAYERIKIYNLKMDLMGIENE